MAAITADAIREERATNNKVVETIAVTTSNTVYIGALVNFVASTGRVASATAAASRRFAGIVEGIVNDSGSALTAITGNTAGTVKVRVAYGHQVKLACLTALRTYSNVSKYVYVGDNNSVTDATGAGTAAVRVVVGTLAGFTSSAKTLGWVELRRIAETGAT